MRRGVERVVAWRLSPPLAWSAVLTLVVLAPLLRPGFVLSYDMVFTPRQYLTPAAVGLGSALPRAVPVDAVVAVVTTVIPGSLVQKGVLVGALLLAGTGAARLVAGAPAWVRAVAAGLYLWNPYVAERLVLGHWVLLLGYAALPWVLDAARRIRRDEPAGWPRLVLPLALAALAPTGGVLAAAIAVAVVGPGLRRRAAAAGLAAVLNGPWWVPAILHSGDAVSDPTAVAAFAARAESWAGTVGSLLGLGGGWNADAVPASRGSVLAPVFTGIVLALAVAGVPRLRALWGRAVLTPVAALAVGGLLLAAAGSWSPSADALDWLVRTVPGAGLVRDGQKWVAPLALLLAPAAALGVAACADRLRARRADPGPPARWPVAIAGLLLPVAFLPDLAWGAFGRLEPVRYPADWNVVRDLLAADGRAGDVVATPFAAFRAFAWNGGRTVLDPAPRYLPRTVVVDDRLVVGGAVVRGEDPRAAAVGEALRSGGPLAPLGVGWVLVEHGTPGPQPDLSGAELAYGGTDLSLYRVAGRPTAPRGPPAWPVVLADAAAVAMVAGALAVLCAWMLRRRLRARAGHAEDSGDRC